MTGKSEAHLDKSGFKNKVFSVATPARCNMLAQDKDVLLTKYQILEENHQTLKREYATLQQKLKDKEEVNEATKLLEKKLTKKSEATEQSLLDAIQRERIEKEKMIETNKRLEGEKEAIENELSTKIEELKRLESEKEDMNKELLITKGKHEEELKMMRNKINELANRLGEVEIKCLTLKSLYDAENLKIGNEANNLVLDNQDGMVDDHHHNVNTTHVEIECSALKSLYTTENLTDLEANKVALDNEDVMVDDDHHNVNNTHVESECSDLKSLYNNENLTGHEVNNADLDDEDVMVDKDHHNVNNTYVESEFSNLKSLYNTPNLPVLEVVTVDENHHHNVNNNTETTGMLKTGNVVNIGPEVNNEVVLVDEDHHHNVNNNNVTTGNNVDSDNDVVMVDDFPQPVNNFVTDPIVISDDSGDEIDTFPRVSSIEQEQSSSVPVNHPSLRINAKLSFSSTSSSSSDEEDASARKRRKG